MAAQRYTSQQVGTYYNQMAEYYRLVWGGSLHMGYWHENAPGASFLEAQENLSDLMIDRTPVGGGHSVLDVGCGYGRPGARLGEKTGCKVTGITISEAQVAEANRYAGDRGVADRVTFQLMDAMAMSFADASFDAAWAFECLFHMPDRAQVLREIARVVRPGGRLVLTDSCEKLPLTEIETQLVHGGFQVNSFITPEQYSELLSTLGYRVLDVLDISSNTAHTVTHVLAATSSKREALQAAYGSDFVQQMQQAGPLLEHVNREKMRYFLIVAEAHARA